MRKMLFVFALVALFAIPAMAGSHAPDAGELWTKITKDDPYQEWDNWPDHKGLQNGVAPHGPLHVVYVNKTGLSKKGSPKPYGTIVVKENFTKDKKLAAITVMYKVKGYNPPAGDWFWVKYTPDGKAAKAGKPSGCIGCHGSRSDSDYIMVSDY